MEDHSNCCGQPRRSILQTLFGLASVAAVSSGTSAAAQPKRLSAEAARRGRIDSHAHLWPVEYLDFIEKAGENITEVARGIRATDSAEDLKARFAMMDKAGVKTQVLSATPQMVQLADASTCLQGARMINDRYAELVKQYPDRFMAYGAVPLPHVNEAIAEARRCINELGFAGIAINTL